MTIDISFIHNNLPSITKQVSLLKERLEALNTEDYKFTFVNSVLDPHKSLKLGIARDVNTGRYNFTEENKKCYLHYDVLYVIDGLVFGIFRNCREQDKKEVIILLPEATLERCYLSTYIQEGNVMLAGFVRIYFDN